MDLGDTVDELGGNDTQTGQAKYLQIVFNFLFLGLVAA
jgi:hypothetical protein